MSLCEFKLSGVVSGGVAIGLSETNSNARSRVYGMCGSGLQCSGGGGQCGAGLQCGGGGGQCGAGLQCSGGGGQCGAGLQCGGT